MKHLKNSLNNNKKYLKIMLLLLCLGFFIGFILTHKLNLDTIVEQIKNIEEYLKNNNINFIFTHISTLSILFIVSLTIIGIILFPLNIIYEGICISINILTFTKAFKLNGSIYGIIYILLTKAIYIILSIIILKKVLIVLKTLFSKKDIIEKKETIIKKLKQIILYGSFIIINDIFIFLFANKILSLFLFIIK